MNQSINTANFDGNEMANDIWAMLGAPENTAENAFKMPHQAIVSSEEKSMNNAPDLATEILSKLDFLLLESVMNFNFKILC